MAKHWVKDLGNPGKRYWVKTLKPSPTGEGFSGLLGWVLKYTTPRPQCQHYLRHVRELR